MGAPGAAGELAVMNFDVRVNEQPWRVALEPAEQPGRFQVIVKGRQRSVDVAWIDSDTLSVLDGATVREIGVRRSTGGEIDLLLDGKMFRAIVSEQPKGGRAPDPLSARQSIVAPMPGRVVRVLVAPGDRVVARQAVVIVEAMKMENELRSPGDGIVKEVTVREGAAIEAGTVLVVIER
jgi:acetyl/propionyl-CoA carboxylase alpha subunit